MSHSYTTIWLLNLFDWHTMLGLLFRQKKGDFFVITAFFFLSFFVLPASIFWLNNFVLYDKVWRPLLCCFCYFVFSNLLLHSYDCLSDAPVTASCSFIAPFVMSPLTPPGGPSRYDMKTFWVFQFSPFSVFSLLFLMVMLTFLCNLFNLYLSSCFWTNVNFTFESVKLFADETRTDQELEFFCNN